MKSMSIKEVYDKWKGKEISETVKDAKGFMGDMWRAINRASHTSSNTSYVDDYLVWLNDDKNHYGGGKED